VAPCDASKERSELVKLILAAVTLASLTSGAAVVAEPVDAIQMVQNDGRYERDRNDRNRVDQDGRRDRGDNPGARKGTPRWSRGDHLPREYMREQFFVSNWRERNLRQPPRGHRWVRNDSNDFFLVAISTGVLVEVVYRNDRDDRWRRRYSQTYSYNDDGYYRECRNSLDPAGIIAGAVIGGLLGNAVGRGGEQAGATIAGIVVGGAVGAALTNNLDCDDRSYAYRTYSDAFNSGHIGRRYRWHNPGLTIAAIFVSPATTTIAMDFAAAITPKPSISVADRRRPAVAPAASPTEHG